MWQAGTAISQRPPKNTLAENAANEHPMAYANLPCVWMTDSSSWAPQKCQVTVLLLLPQRIRGVQRPDLSEGAHLQVSDSRWRGHAKRECFTLSLTYLFAKQYPWKKHHQLGLKIQLLLKSPALALGLFAPSAKLNPLSSSNGTEWDFK